MKEPIAKAVDDSKEGSGSSDSRVFSPNPCHWGYQWLCILPTLWLRARHEVPATKAYGQLSETDKAKVGDLKKVLEGPPFLVL